MKVSSSGDRWQYLESKYVQTFDDALDDMAQGVAAVAQQIAPVDTGTFRASIQVERVGALMVVIISDVEYAAFLEYGTVFMDAQPTFRPAYEQTRRESVQHLVTRLAKVA